LQGGTGGGAMLTGQEAEKLAVLGGGRRERANDLVECVDRDLLADADMRLPALVRQAGFVDRVIASGAVVGAAGAGDRARRAWRKVRQADRRARGRGGPCPLAAAGALARGGRWEEAELAHGSSFVNWLILYNYNLS